MADEYTKDKHYRIIHYIQKDSGSYFESDTTWYWELRDNEKDKLITIFVESDFENASGRKQSGAKSVSFSPDETCVIVEYYDSPTERFDIKTGKKLPDEKASKSIKS